jgi:hypothetical protein
MSTPELPEGVHLALIGGHFTSWSRSEDFHLKDTNYSKHGNTAVLDFSFTEPVEVDTDIVNVGKSKGVKANVSSHGPIELLRKEKGRKEKKTKKMKMSLFKELDGWIVS